MTSNSFSSATTGWVALIAGLVCVLAIILIALFFTLGQPFGTLNDLANGLAGILCGLLAWVLYAQHPSRSALPGQFALMLALIGVLLVLAGTVLVVSNVMGAVQAGWYTASGNALIGVWLAAFGYSALRTALLPANLSLFGTVVGLLMAVGLVAFAGIVAGTDTMTNLPWYLNLAFVGVLGTYVLFPVWAIWLGRHLLRG